MFGYPGLQGINADYSRHLEERARILQQRYHPNSGLGQAAALQPYGAHPIAQGAVIQCPEPVVTDDTTNLILLIEGDEDADQTV